ncbi:MAG: DEAD/DEAH box helicase [Balneolaceae bacterium]
MKFTEFNLSDSLIAGLNDVQFNEPTAVQEKSIPIVMEGKDLISTAQTGTGKTGAFVIPIMERILQSKREGVKALILSPTRELATQIDEQVFAIGYHASISSATVIGGSDFSVQAKALKAGVDIIVATPGRLMDQHKVMSIDFSKLEYLVLDEADRMLDMGFLPDIKKIISWLPENRQTLLFSATMPIEIQKLASTIMKNPETVEIERSKPAQSVEQRAYTLLSNQKIPLVKGIFKELEWESCIIFTSTKKGTDELQRLLKKEGIKAQSIHGDRSQDERNKALNAFKNGQVPVIVATDVLARGIDIKGVSIIINYDVPNNADDYIHRVGRTGRYDKSGIAITFVTRRDSRTFQDIKKIKENKIKTIDVPENFKHTGSFSWKDDFDFSPKQREQKPDLKETSEDKGEEERSTRDSTQDQKRSQKSKSKSKSNKENNRSEDSNKQSTKKVQSKDRTDTEKESKKPVEKKKSNKGQKPPAEQESVKPSHSSSPSQSSSSTTTADKAKKANLPPIHEKAVEYNKRARTPSKGMWGLFKSYIPRFRK